jgi:FkbM family methyltransferase
MQHSTDVRQTPPWFFQAARWLQGRRVRGAHRLESYARARGWLDVTVRYRLGARAEMNVPLRHRPYGLSDLLAYEYASVEFTAAHLRRIGRPALLLDCGADIGLISARLVARCPTIARVIALEPNAGIFPTLAENMALLEAEATARCAAVSDFVGRGSLAHPPHSRHDHAAYLVPDPSGSVEVTTIDALEVGGDLGVVLKVDVEGGETAALRGATETLSRAPWFLVSFEAHRLQSQRAGIEPIELVERLRALRPCEVFAVRAYVGNTLEEAREVRRDRPFFQQFAGGVYNVIAIAR